MLFAIVRGDSVVKTIRVAKPFSLDGRDYNEKWYERMSADDKAALGIKEVLYGSRADERFYWITEEPISVVNGQPVITYTAIPKDLDQLKVQQINQAKDKANSELAATDWMVIRKAERGIEIPADIITKRSNILAECADKEAAINSSNTVEELIEALNPPSVIVTESIEIAPAGSAIGV
jgi:hypothetical protein